jgi:glutamine---fructose-6-phosphate transaminase (isomerizing)
MLLWEEAAKQPASALTTGSFRHGPQEIVNDKINAGIWLDSTTQNNDIKLINDLNKHCAGTLTIGTAIPSGTKGHVIEIPPTPTLFHPVVNIIPLQIASEKLSLLKGETPDSFKFCDFVVETEGGL